MIYACDGEAYVLRLTPAENRRLWAGDAITVQVAALTSTPGRLTSRRRRIIVRLNKERRPKRTTPEEETAGRILDAALDRALQAPGQ